MVSILCIPMLSLFIIYQQVFPRVSAAHYKTAQHAESHLKNPNSYSCETVLKEHTETMFFLCSV